jgi:hypothetical protein
MRLAFAAFFAAALFVVPFHTGAAPTSAPRLIEPIKLPPPTPTPVSGPPVNPSTPTVWLKPAVDPQVTLSGITESMTPGKHGCVVFTITATLNATDAVTILNLHNKNEIIHEARVYVPPSVVYTITNGLIKSYSESAGAKGGSATFTLTEQKYTIQAGSTNTVSADCT